MFSTRRRIRCGYRSHNWRDGEGLGDGLRGSRHDILPQYMEERNYISSHSVAESHLDAKRKPLDGASANRVYLVNNEALVTPAATCGHLCLGVKAHGIFMDLHGHQICTMYGVIGRVPTLDTAILSLFRFLENLQ